MCALKECVVQRMSVTFVVAHLSVGSLPGLLLVFFFLKTYTSNGTLLWLVSVG